MFTNTQIPRIIPITSEEDDGVSGYRFEPEFEQIGLTLNHSQIFTPIEERLARYSPEICERKIERTCRDFCDFANRLWRCWSYHWLKSNPAVPDGETVLQTIERGKSFPQEHDLDGNPIHDVTLAEAMGKSENKAWICFERMFKQYLAERVARIESAEDWWNDFLTYLGGFGVNGPAPKKIEKYEGKVGLRRWLAVVVYNFIRERRRADSRYRRRFSPFPDNWADRVFSRKEMGILEQPLIELVRESFASIPEMQRGTLLFLHVGRLTVRQVAAIYKVDPGTVSRRRQQALSAFRTEMGRRLASLKGRLRTDDLFPKILENHEMLIDMLLDEFESLCLDRMPAKEEDDS